jgi:ligand-binding SRPBCC domain-containing protein
MDRGRRDGEDCRVGDVIDGWTVDAYQPDRRLRLSADLKLPGRGWLEFEVTPLDGGRRSRIRQTATFDPRGVLGRLYWYAVLPFHALIFRGLLRQIARRATRAVPPPEVDVLIHRSIVSGSAADVFRWHERPDALLALLPSRRWVRIESRTGGLQTGERTAFSVGVGPLSVLWEARHYGYVPDEQFCDEQVRGPFAVWRHTHRVEPIGTDQCMYEDRVEYAVHGGAVVRRFTRPLLRHLLTRMFARRHRIVRDVFADARDARLRARYRRIGPPAGRAGRFAQPVTPPA